MNRDIPFEHGGLTQAEAAEREARGQVNAQPRTVGKTTLQIIAGNVFTLFNLLNFILALALILVGSYRNLLFMGVVLSNMVIGTVQELRAKHTIEKLSLLSAPTAEVIRDGAPVIMPAECVVLGDLLVVRQGDQLCVDGEVAGGQGAMDESLLTGESEPVDKRAGDRMLSGTYVTEGTLYVRVTHVGADSYASRLMEKARALRQPHSELMQAMRKIVRIVSVVIVPLGLILLYKHALVMREPMQGAVTATVAAVLGMIPEGLVLLTSVALAVGVIRLGRRNTLVQELYGIETLARVDTLCVDKTGTITQGAMDVIAVEALGDASLSQVEAASAALIGALADNNATLDALRRRFGDRSDWEAIERAPFSSARKWSGVCFAQQGSYVLGAPEIVLGEAMPEAAAQLMQAYLMQGCRVLVLCHSPGSMGEKALPAGLTPLALIALSDVLREDAAPTLEYFARQAVRVKVISGDNPLTVARIAQSAGLKGADAAVDASTLTTREALADAARGMTVFGRVTPEQKKDILMALKEAGHTVGMVGDGVNDIPALKVADCSIAMGAGSDAAKRVAQLTLLDNSFSAVPHIVVEGRRVINNITRAASLFLVKTTFSTLLSLLLVFLPMQYPFAPIQMTLISALTVGIPSFFLALEPNDARVKGNFLRNVFRNALPGGLTVVLLILILFALSGPLRLADEVQSTIATWVTGISGLAVLLFTCLPLDLSRGILFCAMAAAFFAAALLFPSVFYLLPLSGGALWAAIGLMGLALPVMALLRWLVKRLWRGEE